MKKITAKMLIVTLLFVVSGCGGGGSSSTNTATTAINQPPVSIDAATITSFAIDVSTYSYATPHAVTGTYNVSFGNAVAGSNRFYIGLSNSSTVSGVCGSNVPTGYQPLVESFGYISFAEASVTNKVGTFQTSSTTPAKMIYTTPYTGIDYAQPTYVVATLCSPNYSLPLVNSQYQYNSDQKSSLITITP